MRPPTPRMNSSKSLHDVPFLKRSAKCCSPATRFIFTLPDVVIPSCNHKYFNSSSTACRILSCSCDDRVLLGFCRAQSARRLCVDQCCTPVPLIIIMPPRVAFLSGVFAQSKSTFPRPHRPRHLSPPPFKYLPSFFSIFQTSLRRMCPTSCVVNPRSRCRQACLAFL